MYVPTHSRPKTNIFRALGTHIKSFTIQSLVYGQLVNRTYLGTYTYRYQRGQSHLVSLQPSEEGNLQPV